MHPCLSIPFATTIKQGFIFNRLNSISLRENWQEWDLRNSDTFGALYRLKNRITEEFTEDGMLYFCVSITAVFEVFKEYQSMRPVVEAEIFSIIDRRKRRNNEAILRTRRDAIAQYYHRLISERKEKSLLSSTSALPSLVEFRALPILTALQNSAVTDSVDGTIDFEESPVVVNLIEDALQKWRAPVVTTLTQALGHDRGWRSTKKEKLHPVDRINSRFRCKYCKKLGGQYEFDGCLDFAGVCQHKCLKEPKASKASKARRWAVQQFEADAQVSLLIDHCL